MICPQGMVCEYLSTSQDGSISLRVAREGGLGVAGDSNMWNEDFELEDASEVRPVLVGVRKPVTMT